MHLLNNGMMTEKEYSRRKFLIRNSIFGVGTILSLGSVNSLFADTFIQKNDLDLRNANEPIFISTPIIAVEIMIFSLLINEQWA